MIQENKKSAIKTLFVDVKLGDRFVFTMRYKYCPLFKLDLADLHKKILEKRPSLTGKQISIFID